MKTKVKSFHASELNDGSVIKENGVYRFRKTISETVLPDDKSKSGYGVCVRRKYENPVIESRSANIINLTWDNSTGKTPKRGQLLVNLFGNHFKVMESDGKKLKIIQID